MSNRLFWLTAACIAKREMIHFWREKSRVLGFAASPLLFWLVIGAGFSDMGFFFPGAVLLSVMFTAVFSTMSVIEDRRAGFLLSVLASPAPRCAFVIGKVAGGALMAAAQGLLFVMAGWTLRPAGAPFPLLAPIGALLLTGFSFTAIGFWMAWKSRTPQGFHAVMNIALMPLWMVSGALFPLEKAQPWLQAAMVWNPLRYFLALLERTLTPWSAAPAPEPGLAGLITAAAGALFLTLSIYAVERKPYGEHV
jgi:ABC-2 type transport system permease protein